MAIGANFLASLGLLNNSVLLSNLCTKLDSNSSNSQCAGQEKGHHCVRLPVLRLPHAPGADPPLPPHHHIPTQQQPYSPTPPTRANTLSLL